MKRIGTCMAAVIMCALLLAGCSGSGSLSGSSDLFTAGTETCTRKEALVYLTNMREAYENDQGTDFWSGIASGDASAEETLEDLVISRLLQIYCLDLMAAEEGITLSAAEESLMAEAASAYTATLTDADADYLDVSEEEIAEYYGHYALAEKMYGALTEDVTILEKETASGDADTLLAEAKQAVCTEALEAFVATIEISVNEEVLSEEEAAADLSTNQFFSVYNSVVNGT